MSERKMTKEEIEKLRPLASSTEELVYIIAKRIVGEYNIIGHCMNNMIMRSGGVIRANPTCSYCGKVVLITAHKNDGFLRIDLDTKDKCI